MGEAENDNSVDVPCLTTTDPSPVELAYTLASENLAVKVYVPVLEGVNVQEAIPPLTGVLAHEAGSVTFDLPNIVVNATLPVAFEGLIVATTVTRDPADG